VTANDLYPCSHHVPANHSSNRHTNSLYSSRDKHIQPNGDYLVPQECINLFSSVSSIFVTLQNILKCIVVGNQLKATFCKLNTRFHSYIKNNRGSLRYSCLIVSTVLVLCLGGLCWITTAFRGGG
jgi:hypothetical protein